VSEPKFVQISCSQSVCDEYGLQYRLYALDEEGQVWQYLVVHDAWGKLGEARHRR
jgi:hypothetical protein